MFVFRCNICGGSSSAKTAWLERDEPTCTRCQSTVRLRSIIHLLTIELFGSSMPLADVPMIKEVSGLGMTDWAGYAGTLAERFSYVNTYYHQEPRFDVTDPAPEHTARYDFVIASEVLEHVQAPVERSFENIARVLNANGFLILTVPYTDLEDETKEHFPDLKNFKIVELDGNYVLVNRRADGAIETFTDLAFHGGPGSTLEMRLFAEAGLTRALLAAGFREVSVMRESYPQFGIQLTQPWSRPIVARKGRFAFPPAMVYELARAREQAYVAEVERRTLEEAESGSAGDTNSAPGEEGVTPRHVPQWLSAEVRGHLELRRQYDDLKKRHSDLLEKHVRLQHQIAMAAHSRWGALGRFLGMGPRFD